jgi:uncharacterized protein YgiM (DUF1202 family)
MVSLLVCFTALLCMALPAAAQQQVVPILVVNTGALNVRSGPGPQYTVVTSVVGGTTLPVLASNSDGSWYLVATAVGNGWVDVSFTLPRGSFAFVPVINPLRPAPPAAPLPSTLALVSDDDVVPQPALDVPRIIGNAGNLNVRTGPGPQFSVITSVPGGTVLQGLAATPDGFWYLVEGVFGEGWVSAEFTLLRGFFDNLPVINY